MKRVTLGRFAFQYRTRAEWEASQLILYAGELAVEGDTGLMKVGDGRRLYAELPYFNRGPEGKRGKKGDRGETGAALNVKGTKNTASELPAKGTAGDAYMVGGDLYVWSETTWTNVGRIKGEKGDQGVQGPIGPRGLQGATGAKGEKGDIGERGPRGLTGEQGANGIQGPRGETGPRGEKGDKGDPLKYGDLTQAQKQEMANMVSVDLSPYAKKDEVKTHLSDLIDDNQHTTLTKAEKEKVAAIPSNPVYTDTTTTINGKTGEITKEDIEAIGVGGMPEDAVRSLVMQIVYGDYLFGTPTGLSAKIKGLYRIDLGTGVDNSHDLVNNKAALQTLIDNVDVFYVALRSFTFSGEMAASSTAMQAVVASSTAIQAVAESYVAIQAVAASSAAMKVVAASSTAMQAVAASSTAMQAVVTNSTAMQAVAANYTAMQTVLASPTARQAVVGSPTAMQEVASKSTAMQAVVTNSTAMQSVAANSTAMKAVAASSTAMQAVAESSTAMQAVVTNSTAMQALYYSDRKKVYTRGQSITGQFLILEFNSENFFACTFKDGTSLKTAYRKNLAGSFGFLKNYPKIVVNARVDTDSEDYIVVYTIV